MKFKMDDEEKMDLGEVQRRLSQFLGVAEDAVFDYVGSGSSDLSEWALGQLSGMIELPKGFSLTTTIRVPNPGEFFLDVITLVKDERVVVYKALDVVTTINLILEPSDSESEEESSDSSSFDLFLCVLQGGVANYKGSVVRLLLPALDNAGNVVIVNDGSFKVVSCKELEHFNDNSNLNSDIPLSNLLPQLTDNKVNLPKKKDYSDRFDLEFDD